MGTRILKTDGKLQSHKTKSGVEVKSREKIRLFFYFFFILVDRVGESLLFFFLLHAGTNTYLLLSLSPLGLVVRWSVFSGVIVSRAEIESALEQTNINDLHNSRCETE